MRSNNAKLLSLSLQHQILKKFSNPAITKKWPGNITYSCLQDKYFSKGSHDYHVFHFIILIKAWNKDQKGLFILLICVVKEVTFELGGRKLCTVIKDRNSRVTRESKRI